MNISLKLLVSKELTGNPLLPALFRCSSAVLSNSFNNKYNKCGVLLIPDRNVGCSRPLLSRLDLEELNHQKPMHSKLKKDRISVKRRQKFNISNEEKAEIFYAELNRRVNAAVPWLASALRTHEGLPDERWENVRKRLSEARTDVDDGKLWSYVISRCVESKNVACAKSFIAFVNANCKVRGRMMDDILECELTARLKPGAALSVDEWDSVFAEVKRYRYFDRVVSDDDVQGRIINHCFRRKLYVSALSCLEFLRRTGRGPPSLFFRLMFMNLCGSCPEKVRDERLVLDVYEKIREATTVFDVRTTSYVVAGLSLTSRWEECLGLLDAIKLMEPKSYNVDCNYVATAAFKHGRYSLGFEFLRVMDNKALFTRTCLAVVEACGDTCADAEKNMIGLLQYCAQHRLHLPKICTDALKEWFERRYEVTAEYAAVQPSGQCDRCARTLRSNILSKREFESLKEHVMKDVIIGMDVYMKSFPKELARFKSFVGATTPYDVVFDGLNVACTQHGRTTTTEKAQQLSNVVRHFVERNKKVVVIGREHMMRWNKKYMNYVLKNAHCFFTDNRTKDDIFFIYAALNGGPSTALISADDFGDHSHVLKNEELQVLFRRWQLRSQLYLKRSCVVGTVEFQDCILHGTAVQYDDSSVHIPCLSKTTEERDERDTRAVPCNEPPDKWLCISKRSAASKFLFT